MIVGGAEFDDEEEKEEKPKKLKKQSSLKFPTL